MLGQSFIVYSLLMFSLQHVVTAKSDGESDSDISHPNVLPFGINYSPNFLAKNGGLTEKAVSKMFNGHAPVRTCLYYSELRDYYKKNFPDGTNYIYGIDKLKKKIIEPYMDFIGTRRRWDGVDILNDGVAASELVKAAPIPWNSITGWWIIGPGYDPNEFHKKSLSGFKMPTA